MLAIMWVAGALWVRTGIAAERATASEACEALLGVEISAAKIGLPTSGAHRRQPIRIRDRGGQCQR